MNEPMEIKFKILELAYKYDKPIQDVMQDLMRMKIEPVKPEDVEKKKEKGKGS
jgi:hypothetical protein